MFAGGAVEFSRRGAGIEVTRSLAYGDGPRRTLDVYRPSAATAAPVVVFFYGGSWQSGNKERICSWPPRWRGAATSPSSRTIASIPRFAIPDFLKTARDAVRWAKDNAARFGGDPEKLFVMGHSAGAYIAAMLALDGRWLQNVGLAPDRDIAGSDRHFRAL